MRCLNIYNCSYNRIILTLLERVTRTFFVFAFSSTIKVGLKRSELQIPLPNLKDYIIICAYIHYPHTRSAGYLVDSYIIMVYTRVCRENVMSVFVDGKNKRKFGNKKAPRVHAYLIPGVSA